MHGAILELLNRLESDEGAALWGRIAAQVPHLQAKLSAHAAEVSNTVIAELIAQRLRADRADDLLPIVMSQSMLAAGHAAYRKWLEDPRRSLVEMGEEALSFIEQGFARAAKGRTVA